MTLALWLSFVGAVGAVFLTPGPTLMMVMALTLRHGRAILPFLMLGIVCADIIFISLALVGVAALQEVSPTLYWALRLGSLAYVAYLVVKLWQSTPAKAGAGPEMDDLAGGGVVGNLRFTLFAFLTTITNPKGLLFVFGIFPQFIPEGCPLSWAHGATLILTFMSLSLLVSGTWGFFGSFALRGLAQWPHLGKLSATMILIAVGWIWLAPVLTSEKQVDPSAPVAMQCVHESI